MEIILGMALAFVLGAYVRQPFQFKKVVKVEPKAEQKDKKPKKPTKEELYAQDFYNAMNFTGTKQEADNEQD